MGKCFFSGIVCESAGSSKYDAEIINSEAGQYWLDGEVRAAYKDGLDPKQSDLCLHETAKLNRVGLFPYWIFKKDIKDTHNLPSTVVYRAVDDDLPQIDHTLKSDKLLSILGNNSNKFSNPFTAQGLSLKDRLFVGIFDLNELVTWIFYLTDKGYVSLFKEFAKVYRAHRLGKELPFSLLSDDVKSGGYIQLTVEGLSQARSLSTVFGKKVFIAMAFTDENRLPVPSDLREAIRESLDNLGYNPVIVDEEEHNDGIMDKVIALINESKFIIAELTFQKTGVYYEAGYAKGRGLKVIHIVKKEDFDNCHFDVKHLNLIVWVDLDDLKVKLTNRVKASI